MRQLGFLKNSRVTRTSRAPLRSLGPIAIACLVLGLPVTSNAFSTVESQPYLLIGNSIGGAVLISNFEIGANQAPVSYRQAMVRWFGYVAFAFFGIGFLWILLSREKRAWHDLLARTWVVRDLAVTARS